MRLGDRSTTDAPHRGHLAGMPVAVIAELLEDAIEQA
jgi:hypothetical protein